MKAISRILVLIVGCLATFSAPHAMNKNDIIDAVHEETDLSTNDAAVAVDAVFNSITDALRKGHQVRIAGFGTFSVAHRAASEGRNPTTGEVILIPASKHPKFKAGKVLKDAVNKAPLAAPEDDPQVEDAPLLAPEQEPQVEGQHHTRNNLPIEPSAQINVIDVTDESFECEVLRPRVPVLLEFWAESSGPSKMMAVTLNEIASEMMGRFKLAKLNIDEDSLTPQMYGVRGIPTLMVFKEGKVVATKVGTLTRREIANWVESVLGRLE